MNKFYIICFALLLNSCASMVAPSGGEKDTKPPTFVRSWPSPYTVNYKESKIVIEFDEYFTLQNIKEELLISPHIKNTKAEISKKKIVVSWEDSLIDNSTYTLFFGNSIVDVNESNILEGYTFSFATGAFIDSGTVLGKLNKIDNNSPFENCYVYLCKDTLLDSLSLPKNINYVTKSNKEGIFKLNNLKADSFYLYCFEDKNKNKKIDVDEFVGFSLNKVYTFDSSESTIIDMFPYVPKSNIFINKPLFTNQFTLSFPLQKNIFLEREQIKITPNTPFYIHKDSINVITDSVLFPLTIEYGKTKLYTIDSLNKFNKEYVLKVQSMSWPDSTILLELNTPLSYSDLTKILVIKDSVNISSECEFNYSMNNLRIENINCDSCSYKVILQDSFVNIGKWYSRKIEIPIVKKEVNFMEYEIVLNSKNKVENRSVILILENNERVYKKTVSIEDTQTKVKLSNLRSGNYKVKIIFDANLNGLWDNGNINERIHAEAIQIIPNQLEIKENWDGELIIDLDE
jgi:uncharacterized protein (DUF2141 family)